MTGRSVLADEWVPIPAAVLKVLGWDPKQPLELEAIDGVLVCTPAASPTSDSIEERRHAGVVCHPVGRRKGLLK